MIRKLIFKLSNFIHLDAFVLCPLYHDFKDANMVYLCHFHHYRICLIKTPKLFGILPTMRIMHCYGDLNKTVPYLLLYITIIIYHVHVIVKYVFVIRIVFLWNGRLNLAYMLMANGIAYAGLLINFGLLWNNIESLTINVLKFILFMNIPLFYQCNSVLSPFFVINCLYLCLFQPPILLFGDEHACNVPIIKLFNLTSLHLVRVYGECFVSSKSCR